MKSSFGTCQSRGLSCEVRGNVLRSPGSSPRPVTWCAVECIAVVSDASPGSDRVCVCSSKFWQQPPGQRHAIIPPTVDQCLVNTTRSAPGSRLHLVIVLRLPPAPSTVG